MTEMNFWWNLDKMWKYMHMCAFDFIFWEFDFYVQF